MTMLNYRANSNSMLSFKSNQEVRIISKPKDGSSDLWGVEINGKRGFVNRRHLREMRVIIKEPNFIPGQQPPPPPHGQPGPGQRPPPPPGHGPGPWAPPPHQQQPAPPPQATPAPPVHQHEGVVQSNIAEEKPVEPAKPVEPVTTAEPVQDPNPDPAPLPAATPSKEATDPQVETNQQEQPSTEGVAASSSEGTLSPVT